MRVRLAGWLLLLAPGAALAALGPRYGGDLSVGVLDLPSSLEAGVPRDAGQRLALGLVHETLVGITPEGLPLPTLAQGWSIAAGGREWTIQLRSGAAFHDDRPVTADDVVRSLRRFLRSPSPAAERLAEELDGGLAFRSRAAEELPGLQAPDAASVVLRFDEPGALPLAPLASPAAAVTGSSGAGCGPFIPTLDVPGRRVGLTAFLSHVRGRPFLDRVLLLGLADWDAARAEVQAGRLDLAPGAGGPSALAATLLLILDPARPPFDREGARTAVAAAVDRGDLVAHLLPGGDPSAGLLVPALLPPLDLGAQPARGALGGRVQMVVARDVPPLLSQRIVAYLGAAGIEVGVAAVAPTDAPAASAPARLVLWAPEVPEAGLALSELAALAPPVPAAREALAAAGRETDLDRRREQLHRAEAALREGHVLVPLASVPVSFAARAGVHGAKVDLAGRLVLEDAWVEP